MSQPAQSCFVDADVFRHAENTEVEWGEQEIACGSWRSIMQIPRMQLKRPRNTWLAGEIEKLYTVSRLARQGILRLCWSDEVWEEQSGTRRGKNTSFPEGRPFARCERLFVNIDSPITRTRLFPESFGIYDPPLPPVKERIIKFCQFLFELESDQAERLINSRDSNPHLRFPDREKDNLRGLGRFRDLCGKDTNNKHLADCFHLWTAEVNKLDYFLSCDTKFRRFIKETRRITPTVRMVTPSELLADLGITEFDPVPLVPDRSYTILELLSIDNQERTK